MVKKTGFYRLLKPSEVFKIESEIKNPDLRMSLKTAVFTGMRYKELQLFEDHPEWFHYNRNIIYIPEKHTKTRAERKINLTMQSPELLYYFLQGGHRLNYSEYQSWSPNLGGLSLGRILASQGYEMNTSIKHYYNYDVTLEDRIKMKEMTQGRGYPETPIKE